MVEVIKVESKKQQKEFLNFPLNLYKDNPYFVPPLYMDEKKIFDKNYVYYVTSEAVFFNAFIDGKMVGRISAILQHASNDKWNQKRIRFTRFDSINDQRVADALFAKVEEYAKSKNMNEIVGPLGFSDLEREGLLIDGFDQLSTFEEQYNYDYYQKLIENCGYGKDVDWIEHKVSLKEEKNERLEKFSQKILDRFNLKLVKEKSTRRFIKKYGDQFFDIVDIAYDKLYGTVPLTDKVKKMMLDNFKLLVDSRYVSVIVDSNDKVVCAAVCFPSIGKALQKSGGRLTIPALFKVLYALKKPKVLDMALIGVLDEYKMKGVSSVMFNHFIGIIQRNNIEYCETNLTLEENHNIINQWKNFNAIYHKRRRCFVKKI